MFLNPIENEKTMYTGKPKQILHLAQSPNADEKTEALGTSSCVEDYILTCLIGPLLFRAQPKGTVHLGTPSAFEGLQAEAQKVAVQD